MEIGQQGCGAVDPGQSLCRVSFFHEITDNYDFNERTFQNVFPFCNQQYFSDTRNLLQNNRVFSYQVFCFGPVRLNFFQQYRDAPLSYARKNSKPDFLETQKCSSTIFLGTVGKNLSNEKKVISLLMHKVHRHPKFCETLKGSPTKFSALWDEKCSTENHDTSPAPPLHLFHTFSAPKIFWNTEGTP